MICADTQPPAVASAETPAPARAAYLAGDFRRAEALYRARLAAEPADVDARLGLGLALSAQGRDGEAQPELEAVVRQAPGYADASLALARLALRRGDYPVAAGHLARALEAAPDNPEARTLAEQIARGPDAPRPWRMDALVSHSWLGAGRPDWREASVSAGRRFTGFGAAGSVQVTDRFDRTDVYLEASGEGALAGGWVWRAAVGGAPEAEHRAKLAGRVGGSAALPGAPGLRLEADFGVADYALDDIVTVEPAVSATLADGRVTVSAAAILVRASSLGWQEGYMLRGRFGAEEGPQLSLTWADAPEVSTGSVEDVQAFAAGLSVPLRQDLRVGVTGLRESRPAYHRNEVSLAVTKRF